MSEALWNLDAQFRQIRMIAEEEEIDPQAIADTLEGMEDEWLDKMDSCVHVIKLLQGTAKVYDDEAKAFQAKKKAVENNIARIKQAMYESIKLRYPGEKSKPGTKKKFSYWTQYSAKSLGEYDIEKIPAEYFVPQPDKIDTERLLKDMKALEESGKELPEGITLKQTEFLTWR